MSTLPKARPVVTFLATVALISAAVGATVARGSTVRTEAFTMPPYCGTRTTPPCPAD